MDYLHRITRQSLQDPYYQLSLSRSDFQRLKVFNSDTSLLVMLQVGVLNIIPVIAKVSAIVCELLAEANTGAKGLVKFS